MPTTQPEEAQKDKEKEIGQVTLQMDAMHVHVSRKRRERSQTECTEAEIVNCARHVHKNITQEHPSWALATCIK